MKSKSVPCSTIDEQRWGSVTYVTLPGGGKVGAYQPKHPLAYKLAEGKGERV
jgi:hypothetical protein